MKGMMLEIGKERAMNYGPDNLPELGQRFVRVSWHDGDIGYNVGKVYTVIKARSYGAVPVDFDCGGSYLGTESMDDQDDWDHYFNEHFVHFVHEEDYDG